MAVTLTIIITKFLTFILLLLRNKLLTSIHCETFIECLLHLPADQLLTTAMKSIAHGAQIPNVPTVCFM